MRRIFHVSHAKTVKKNLASTKSDADLLHEPTENIAETDAHAVVSENSHMVNHDNTNGVGRHKGVLGRIWVALQTIAARGWKRNIVLVLCLALLLALAMPVPYVIQRSGPALNVLDDIDGTPAISIRNARVYSTRGELLMTTINVEGLGGDITAFEALANWFNPNASVYPLEVFMPSGSTMEEVVHRTKSEMNGAQQSADKAAMKYFHDHHIDVGSPSISIEAGDIGGPSAGMMFTLGVIDKLTSGNLTGGKTIAGTGTIDDDGKVGPIGGIRFKMIGALEYGAHWFLAPQGNCSEVVGHIPAGMQVVRVSTLDEAVAAVKAIASGHTQGLPQCKI